MEGEDREPERRPAQDELGDTGTADKQPDPFQQEAQQLLDRMSASTAESKSTLPTLSSGNEVLLFTDPFAKRGAKSAELPVFALAGAGGEGERAEVGSRRDQQQQERGIRRPAFESKSGTDLPLPVLRLDSGAPATGEAQKEDPLPSFDDEQTRRDSLPAGMLDEIVQAALTDKDAREILRDIATADSRSIFQPYDPVLKAVEHIRQEFPDLKEGLAQAVVKGYQESSRDPIVAFLAESAKNNPDLARQLKEIIGDALRPNQDADTQRLGVSMLLAMSSQWTQDDFFKAVAFLKPDQVSQFRQAIAQAPPEVSKAYTDILRDPTGRLQQQLEEQLPGFGAIKPFGQEQQPDWFKARLQFIASMDARSRGYEIPGMDFLTPAAKDDPFGLLLGRDRNDPAALLTDPFGTKRDSRRDEPYEELFRKAWPDERWRDQSYGRTGRDKTDTTAYLAAGLDRGIFDSDTAVSPQKLFDSWGVKDPSLASSIDEAAAKYGMEALLQLDRRIQLYNSLDPATREELTGKREPVSEAEIAGVILNGRLGAEGTAGAFLMGNPPLEQKFAELLAKTSSDLESSQESLDDKRDAREDSLELLTQFTEDGPSVVDMLDHTADKITDFVVGGIVLAPVFGMDLRTSGLEAWEQEQKAKIDTFLKDKDAFLEEAARFTELAGKKGELDFSRDIYSYQQLAQKEGTQDRRDYLGLAMMQKYGVDALRFRAPQIWEDLTTGGGLERMQKAGLISSDKFPEFDTQDAQKRFEQALDVLTGLERGQEGNLDLPMRRRQALDALDSHPSLLRTQEIAASFSQDFAVLKSLFESGSVGTKYQDYVDLVKSSAANLEQALAKVTPQDIQGLKDILGELEKAKQDAKEDGSRRELEARYESVKNMLDLLDPSTATNIGIHKMLDGAKSRDFNADTLGNWMAENGPVIVAGAAAVAITVASMGTAAPAMAVILASSAAAVVATQATKELLYLTNHYIADTGLGHLNDRSYMGAWGAKHWDSLKAVASGDVTAERAKELVTSYLSEVVGPTAFEFGQNVVMGLVGLGIMRIGQSGLSGLSPQWVRSLVRTPGASAMMEAVEGAESASASSFLKQWLTTVAKETAEETGEEFVQEGVQQVAERGLQQAGIAGPYASILVTVTMSLAQSKIGGHAGARYNGNGDITVHSSVSDTMLKDLADTGHKVTKNPDGTYSVSTYDSPNVQLKIRVTDNAAEANPDTPRRSEGAERPAVNPTDTELAAFADTYPELTGDKLASFQVGLAKLKEGWTEDLSTLSPADRQEWLTARAEQVQTLLRETTGNFALTVVPVDSSTMGDRTGTYEFGKGQIAISSDLLSHAGADPMDLIKTAVHERVHFEQDKAVVDFLLNKNKGNIEAAREEYRQRTGKELSKDFAESIKARDEWQNLSESQKERAREIAKEIARPKTPADSPLGSEMEREAYTAESDANAAGSDKEITIGEHLAARQALQSIADPDTRALVEDMLNSSNRLMVQNFPELIERYGKLGDGLLEKINDFKGATETLSALSSANSQQLVDTLNNLQNFYPGIANDPTLGKMVDQTVASSILKNPALFDGSSSVAALTQVQKLLAKFDTDSSGVKSAVEQRIKEILDTNKAKADLPLEAMSTIANRFGLSAELQARITSYDPKKLPPRTEVVGRSSVADPFIQRDPGRRSASFDEFFKKLTEGTGALPAKPGETKPGPIRTPEDLRQMFGTNGVDQVPGMDNTYWIDVGGNNYRVLARFDFDKGRAEILRVATHAEYDRIKL